MAQPWHSGGAGGHGRSCGSGGAASSISSSVQHDCSGGCGGWCDHWSSDYHDRSGGHDTWWRGHDWWHGWNWEGKAILSTAESSSSAVAAPLAAVAVGAPSPNSESFADAQPAARVTDAQVVPGMAVYGFGYKLPLPLDGYEWYPTSSMVFTYC